MKKIIAMILALTTAANLAVSAVADTASSEGQNPTVSVDTISFEKDANGVDLNSNAILTPGKTYYFPMMYTGKGSSEAKDMTVEQYKNLKFRFADEEGKKMIEEIKTEKHKNQYCLVITTKKSWPTGISEVLFQVSAVDTTDAKKEIAVDRLAFQVGYQQIDQGALNNPEYVVVDPSAPVIMEEDFSALHEAADGKEVTFTYGDWEFAVKVNGLKDLNMLSNQDEIDEIIEKYEGQEFKFVAFPAGPEFRTTGTLYIDVSGEMEPFENQFYVYRYLNGKLTKEEAELDEENSRLVIKTKQLGRFVITNQEIKDAVVVGGDNNTGSGNNSGNGGNGEENPGTGANGFAGGAAALAVAGAALLLSKKK